MKLMKQQICIHCYISGRVQGVFFRAATREEARKLGVTGWARNLSDGRVEVLACGEKKNIDILYEWLKQGPQLAQVTDITYEELPWQSFQDFKTL